MHGSKVIRTGAFAAEANKVLGNVTTMPTIHEADERLSFVQSREYAPLALELFKARPILQHSLIRNNLHCRDEREKQMARKPAGSATKNPETATPQARLEEFELNVPGIFRSDPDPLLEEVCNEVAISFRNRVRHIVLASRLAEEAQRVGFLKRESEAQWRIKLLCKSVREYWNEIARRRTWPEQVVTYSERVLLHENRPRPEQSTTSDPKGPRTATRPSKRTRSPQSSQRSKRRKTSLPSTLVDTSLKENSSACGVFRYVSLDLFALAFGQFPPAQCGLREEERVPDKGQKLRKRKSSSETSAPPKEPPAQNEPVSTSPPHQALSQYSIHTLSALISHILPIAPQLGGAFDPREIISTTRIPKQANEECQLDLPKLLDRPPKDDANEILYFIRDTRTRRKSATDAPTPISPCNRKRGHSGAKESSLVANSQSLSRMLTLSSAGSSDFFITHPDLDSAKPNRESWSALPKHVLPAVLSSQNPWWVASNKPKTQEAPRIRGSVTLDWSLPPRLVELHSIQNATTSGWKETSKSFGVERDVDKSLDCPSFVSRLGVSRPMENSDTLVFLSLMSLFMAPRPEYFPALLALNLLWNLSCPAEVKLPASTCQKLVETFSSDPNFASITRDNFREEETVAPSLSDPQQNMKPFDAEDLNGYLAGVFPAPVALQEYFAQTLMKFPLASDWVKKCWDQPHVVSRVSEKTFQAELFGKFDEPEVTWAQFILPFDAFIFFIKRLGREKRRSKLAQLSTVTGAQSSVSLNLHSQPSRKWQPAGYNGGFVLQHALQADGTNLPLDESARPPPGGLETVGGYQAFDGIEALPSDLMSTARETNDVCDKSGRNRFSKNCAKVLDILPKWMVSLKLGTRWKLWSFLDALLQNYTSIGGLIAPGVGSSDASSRVAKSSKMQSGGASSGKSMLSALTSEGFIPLSPENFPPPIAFSRAIRSILPNNNNSNSLCQDATSPSFAANQKPVLFNYAPGDLKQVEFFTNSLSSFPTVVTIKSCAKIARKLELSWHPVDDVVIWSAVLEQVDIPSDLLMKNSKKTADLSSDSHSSGLLKTFSQYVQHARRAKGFSPSIMKNTCKVMPLFHRINWTHVAHTFNLSLPPFDRYRSGKVCESKFHSLMVEYLCAMYLQPSTNLEMLANQNMMVQIDSERPTAPVADLIPLSRVEIEIRESATDGKTDQQLSDILDLLEKSLLENDQAGLNSCHEQLGPENTRKISVSMPEAHCLCAVSDGFRRSNSFPKDFIDFTVRLKDFKNSYSIPLAIKSPPSRTSPSSDRTTENLADFYTNVWNPECIDQALNSPSLPQRAKGIQLGKLRDAFESSGLVGAHVLSRMLRRDQDPPESVTVGMNPTTCTNVDKLIKLFSLGTYFSQLQRLASHMVKSSGPNGVFTRKRANITKLQDLILMNRPLRVYLNANNACVNTLQGMKGLLTDKMSDSSSVTPSAVYQHTLLNCHRVILPSHSSQLYASTNSCLPLIYFGFAETWLHDPLGATSQCWNILDFCFPSGTEAAFQDPVKQQAAVNYLTVTQNLRGNQSPGTLKFTKTPFPTLKFVSLFESGMGRTSNRGIPAVTSSPTAGSYPNKSGVVGRFEPGQAVTTNSSVPNNGVNLPPRNISYYQPPAMLMGSSPSMGFGPSNLGPLQMPPPQQPMPYASIPPTSFTSNAPWGNQPSSYQQLPYGRLGVSGMAPGNLPATSGISCAQTVQAKPRPIYYDRFKMPAESGWMGVGISSQAPSHGGFAPQGFPPHQQFAQQPTQYRQPPLFTQQGSPNAAQNPHWQLRVPTSGEPMQMRAMNSSSPEYWMQLGAGQPDVSRLQWQERQTYQPTGERSGGMPISAYNVATGSAGSWSGSASQNPSNSRSSGWPSSRRAMKSMATAVAGGSEFGDGGASSSAGSDQFVGGFNQGFSCDGSATGPPAAPPPMWGYEAGSEGGAFRAPEPKKFS